MLRSGTLSRHCLRLVGSFDELRAAVAAARLAGNPRRYNTRAHVGPQPHKPGKHQRRQLHLRRTKVANVVGPVVAGRHRVREANGQIAFGACGGALGHDGLGARREFWSPFNKGSKPGGGESGGSGSGSGSSGGSAEGFSETTGAEGDSWTPPPDAWRPDDATPPGETEPQDPLPDFDAGDGFGSESVADMTTAGAGTAAPDAVAAMVGAGSDAVATATAAAAAGMSAADLTLYYPHHICMKIIEAVHTTVGVPYWEAIVITSLVARIAVLPAFITFQGMAKRMSIVRVEMEPLQAKLKDIKARVEANPELQEAGQQEMSMVFYQIQDLLRKHRISYPTMILCMFGQIPVFISLFVATQEMGQYFPGYATGGLEWVSNLAVPDPTYILPVIACSTMVIMMEVGGEVQPPQRDPTKPQPMNMKNVFRAMSLIFIPVAFNMPAGVLVYWSTTNVFGLVQRGAFSVRAVQKMFGWPLPEDMPSAATPKAGTDDLISKDDLERWAGGRHASDASRQETAEGAAERARAEIAKASKTRHEELKRQYTDSSEEKPSTGGDGGDPGDDRDRDRRQ